MKGLLITGDRSGSGKTSITLALSALLSRAYEVQTFKVGMDYIDPSYHTGVTGRPCRNLDSYVMGPAQNRAIFEHACTGADIALVEGVRGLFEGSEALSNEGSTASIATLLDLNVILVVNARSITRSAAAIVRGFMDFDPGIRIRGVILNNIGGETHRQKAVTAIEHHCEIPVVGAIPRTEEMHLTMRHLGLVPYLEGRGTDDFLARIDAITGMIEDHVSLDALLDCAGEVAPPARPAAPPFSPAETADVRIGVALDEAFNFYYADLFDLLASLGAECVPFSPVHDRLPDADGYILGGGYPELYAEGLEENDAMREAVREVSRSGTPIYAECGGLLYLTDRILLKQGWQDSDADTSHAMCGVFAGEARMPGRRVVGYVEGQSSAASPLGSAPFRGHEFHHTDVVLAHGTPFAYRLTRGIGINDTLDGAIAGRTQASYTHLHPVASRSMLAHFVGECRNRS
ncbi:MAG: Ni-sirohydrochlorin a,c-diamide synthase [Methanomicrobiaceae archaeon]|nr:Ni-sirohydrochlorin a,c-diamide synthase [Methanomicrobiaceae archaeon]